jgi:hypothetical protein
VALNLLAAPRFVFIFGIFLLHTLKFSKWYDQPQVSFI